MAVCYLCEIPFPNNPEDGGTKVLTNKDLYAARWAPLQDQIYCPECIVRAMAMAIDTILNNIEEISR